MPLVAKGSFVNEISRTSIDGLSPFRNTSSGGHHLPTYLRFVVYVK